MTLQQSSYHKLPVEILLHILKFLDLETLVDTVRYIDKTHRELVIDILRNYKLKQEDCTSYWFDFIKNQRAYFLHKYLSQQDKDFKPTYICSPNTHQNTISWYSYLQNKKTISIKHNDIEMYTILTNKTNKGIYIKYPNSKIYLSYQVKALLDNINLAIEYNSLHIIKYIFTYKKRDLINYHEVDELFNFNRDEPEDKTFECDMFYKFAEKAIFYNRVDILNYFTLKYNYTNEHYNSLLFLCTRNNLVNKAFRENKPNVMEYIIALFTDTKSSNTDSDGKPYHIIEDCITNCRFGLIYDIKSSYSYDIKSLIYFLTKFINVISIKQYTEFMIDILNIGRYNELFKQLFILYLDTYTIFPECALYTPEHLLINDNLMVVIENIKTSLIYHCFIISIKKNNTELMSYLKEILLTSCIKYNLTKKIFVTYLVLDCIKHSIVGIMDNHIDLIHHNTLRIEIFTILIQDLPSIYDIDTIVSIMNILTLEIYYVVNYEYFHNLFLQKSVLTRRIYINLLKNNLYLSLQNTKNDVNKVFEFIILKLKENGETNICKDTLYEVLFINAIKTKYITTIEYLFQNGFDIRHNNEYSQLAINSKCYDIIKLFAVNGINLKLREHNILHFILKQKTKQYRTLAIQIKQKLIATNKLQEYLDWETNLDYKTKFLEKT